MYARRALRMDRRMDVTKSTLFYGYFSVARAIAL